MSDLEKLKKHYRNTKAPDWLLQDTLQKANQSVVNNILTWAAPIIVGVVSVLGILIFMPQESDTPALRSPSFSNLQVNSVKPDKFRFPSFSSMTNIPSMPKTPKIPQDKKQTSKILIQDTLNLSNLFVYKEVNKHV